MRRLYVGFATYCCQERLKGVLRDVEMVKDVILFVGQYSNTLRTRAHTSGLWPLCRPPVFQNSSYVVTALS